MEYLRTDTVSVGTLYRKAAKLSRGAGVCFCKHFVPAGAQGAVACRPCRCGVRRGAWRFWSPACPAFSLLSFPHPPAPLPGGKGENHGYFMQGASPLASPGLNPRGTGSPCQSCTRRGAFPLRHLLSLPLWCPQGGLNPGGTGSPCPGGEDHLKRRSSSPPVPPLLGCRHCS